MISCPKPPYANVLGSLTMTGEYPTKEPDDLGSIFGVPVVVNPDVPKNQILVTDGDGNPKQAYVLTDDGLFGINVEKLTERVRENQLMRLGCTL